MLQVNNVQEVYTFDNLHATLLRCKLKSVVARITTQLKHCHTTKYVVAS